MLSIKVIKPRHHLKGLNSEMFIWECPHCRWEIRQTSHETIPLTCPKCRRILPNTKAIMKEEYHRVRWHRQKMAINAIESPIYSIYRHPGD